MVAGRKTCPGSSEKPYWYLLARLIIWCRRGIWCIGRSVVETHIPPDIERHAQRTTPLRRLLQDLRPLIEVVSAFIARLNHRLHRNAVRCCTGSNARRVTDRATAKLQHHIFPQVVEQLVHLPSMNAT